MHNGIYDVTWTEVDGHAVLNVRGSKYIAAPITGRKNSARFVMIHLDEREEICQLKKKEVTAWLCRQARNEDVPSHY